MPKKRFIWNNEAGIAYKFGAQRDIARRLKQLFLSGRLDAARYSSGLDYFDLRPDLAGWRVFFERVLGLAGALFFLAGVIMFLAWNWQDFPKFIKFGLFELIFTGFGLLAFWRWKYSSSLGNAEFFRLARRDVFSRWGLASSGLPPEGKSKQHSQTEINQRFQGEAALLCVGISLGALLALHGQIYQTGANSPDLFRTWFLLLLPLFVLARSTGLGLLLWITASLWLLLRQYLFASSFDLFDGPASPFYSLDALLLAQLAAWLLCEVFCLSKSRFFASFDPLRWLTRLVAAAFMLLISCKITFVILEPYSYYHDAGQTQFFGLGVILLYLGVLAGSLVFYYRKFPDLFMLTLGIFSLAGLSGVYLLKALFADQGGGDELSLMLLAGLILIALCLGVAQVIFRLRRGMLRQQAAHEADSGGLALRNLAVWRNAGAQALRDWLADAMSEEEITAFLAGDETEQEQAQPWYIKVPMAVGIWIGTLFILAFLLLLAWDDLRGEGFLILGLILCAGGAALFRNPGFALRQLGLALIFCGLMAAAAPFVGYSYGLGSGMFIMYAAIFCCLWLLLPYAGARVICFAAALASLFMFLLYLNFDSLFYYSYQYQAEANYFSGETLTLRILAALFFCVPCMASLRLFIAPRDRAGNVRLVQSLRESAFGGALLFLLTASLLFASGWFRQMSALQFVPLGLCLGFMIGTPLLAYKTQINLPPLRLLLPAGVLLALLAWLSASIALGVLLLLLARSRSDVILCGFAAAYLGLAVLLFYYHLDIPFLWKAFSLSASGLLLAAAALAARRFLGRWPQTPHSSPLSQKKLLDDSNNNLSGGLKKALFSGRVALLLVLFLILFGFNFSLAAKELLLRNGQVMLLELAPIDPLSFLQGYYMDLDLRAERDIAGALENLGREFEDNPHPKQATVQIPAQGQEGLAVMRKLADKSEFVRLYESGTPLAAGESLLAFRVLSPAAGWRQAKIRISGGSFFFEEGQAQTYNQARFALLRVSPDGEALIAGLCDAEGNVIRSGER